MVWSILSVWSSKVLVEDLKRQDSQTDSSNVVLQLKVSVCQSDKLTESVRDKMTLLEQNIQTKTFHADS